MVSKQDIEKARKFWAGIAKENGWYEEPFYVIVYVNQKNEVVDSLSNKNLSKDTVIHIKEDEEE
jgi:heat shock protein HspQ